MRLYHTGFCEIRSPDVRRGRTTADLGQGFYLTPDPGFARRWARSRPGADTVLNTYELDTADLSVLTLLRDEKWFDYVYSNRNALPDKLPGYDVIIGPVANDTIYDLFGITTSGVLSAEQALAILTTGPEYTQAVLKTEKAARALEFLSSRVIGQDEIERGRAFIIREQDDYRERFTELLSAALDG